MPHALIIDDTPSNTTIMGKLLNDAGFSYTGITHPDQLISALDEADHIDIIFTDLNLQDMTGYDVLTQLRQREISVPIVACSVYTDEIVRAREMGFSAFIGYPIKMGQFIGQVQRIMNGESVWEK